MKHGIDYIAKAVLREHNSIELYVKKGDDYVFEGTYDNLLNAEKSLDVNFPVSISVDSIEGIIYFY